MMYADLKKKKKLGFKGVMNTSLTCLLGKNIIQIQVREFENEVRLHLI